MLRAIIICPDQDLGERLEEQLLQLGQVGIAKALDRYPSNLELIRYLRAHAPQVVFLSIETLSKAFDVVAAIEANSPGVQIIAIHRICDPQVLLELMRAGIREFVSLPFHVDNLRDALLRISEMVEKKPPSIESTDLLFTFLPSKAGVGTSTIALNASIAVSSLPDTNTLLMDLDLNSGMVRFMLKLDNPYSITDAAENATRMDENLWPPMVTNIGKLDVLHAGKLNPDVRIEAPQIRHLLDFARRNYKVICIDLSGNLEKYSLEIMHESKRIFLCCTPEIPSLHLAREKFNFLKALDLGDRVGILLNRAQKRSLISPAQIEELLGAPVQLTFPNDYQGVHKALSAGRHVEVNSELGRQFSQLAKVMIDRKAPVSGIDPRKRFVEYFSIIPARYSIFPEGKKPVL